eukprot:SAG31_NODE_555_length_14169_cov_19.798721_2_plen_49_part_00
MRSYSNAFRGLYHIAPPCQHHYLWRAKSIVTKKEGYYWLKAKANIHQA